MTIFDMFNQIERGLNIFERIEQDMAELVKLGKNLVEQGILLNKALRGK